MADHGQTPRSQNPGSGQGPKYLTVANAILRSVESGRWKPGDQLPSETDLAEQMQVSLGTVQKALKVLTDQGLVLRHHGRGTFVGSGRAPDEALRHFRFLAEGGRELLPVVSRVLSIDETAEQGPWAMFLGPADSYIRLSRILHIGGEFELSSEMYLPGEKFRQLLEVPTKSLHGVLIRDYLTTHFNTPTLKLEQQMRCGTLPPRVCNLINVPRNTMGLIWTLFAFTYRESPAIYQKVFVPPSDRELQIIDAGVA
ncbi:MAG: GntR family transcriptional regulator [Hyphomicrobiaceae bacterium]